MGGGGGYFSPVKYSCAIYYHPLCVAVLAVPLRSQSFSLSFVSVIILYLEKPLGPRNLLFYCSELLCGSQILKSWAIQHSEEITVV